MSYLLELLGRGLLGQLVDAFPDFLSGQPGDTPEGLEERLASASSSLDLRLRAGIACLRDLRLADARRHFTLAAQRARGDVRPWLGLACVHDESDRLDEALRCLDQAATLDPENPAIDFARGFCEERSSAPRAAEHWYRTAVTRSPRLRNGYERLAALAAREHDWLEAATWYEKLAALEPDDVDVLLSIAGLQLQSGDARAAVESYQRALLIEPEVGDEAWSELDGLDTDEELDAAIHKLEQLVVQFPGVCEFRVHLADQYVKRGADAEALAQYRAALEIRPGLLEAAVKLGTQHLRRDRFLDAARHFNQAVTLSDRLLLAFVGLGVAQHEAGREREADATFDLAVSLAPNSVLLLAETARLHRKARAVPSRAGGAPSADASDVDAFFSETMALHLAVTQRCPDRCDARYRYALLCRHAGDFDAALENLAAVAARFPSFAGARIKHGVALREHGRRADALHEFRAALHVDAEEFERHALLAQLFAKRNFFELALERFEERADTEFGDGWRENLSLALRNVNLLDRAAADWHALDDLEPPPLVDCATRGGRPMTDD